MTNVIDRITKNAEKEKNCVFKIIIKLLNINPASDSTTNFWNWFISMFLTLKVKLECAKNEIMIKKMYETLDATIVWVNSKNRITLVKIKYKPVLMAPTNENLPKYLNE